MTTKELKDKKLEYGTIYFGEYCKLIEMVKEYNLYW